MKREVSGDFTCNLLGMAVVKSPDTSLFCVLAINVL